MNSLSSRDFDGLQRAIIALYSHRDITSFRAAVPGIFLDLIRADYFSLADIRIDPEKRSVKILDLWESRPVTVGKIFDAMQCNLCDHPFSRYKPKNGKPGALILSDFLTLAQLRRTRLYREALKPAKVGRLLSIGAFGGPGLATLSLARAEAAPDFTERDRQLLECLRPHFDQARANLDRESQLRTRRAQSLKKHGMTPREITVGLWLAQGKTNREIADILSATGRTIEKHVEHILRKLGVENRAAAAVTMAEIIRA